MWVEYGLFILGIYLLIKSADWIVDGASSLAKKLGVSSLIIGLTVVAFGTSLPELVVNVFAAIKGSGEVAFGNIIGSNIANILLALGVTAVITNVKVKSDSVWKEIPFALLSAFVLFALASKMFFGEGEFFNRSDGLVLLGLFGVFLYYTFRKAGEDKLKNDESKKDVGSNSQILFRLIIGLIGIYFGGKYVVDGAIFIAGQLGLSEFLISATVVAIGTSLPELVVCVVAALKKNIDLAVGNVIGSNIFNVLWVFGVIPFFGVLKIPKFVLVDIGIMFLVTLVLFLFMFVGRKHELRRVDGILFLLLYILYICFLIHRG